MYKQEPDSALEALDDKSLRTRLESSDWRYDPKFVSDEQVFRMFRHARTARNKIRIALLSEAFSRRLLGRARNFALKANIFPGLIDDLNRASHEIASEIWEQLATNEKDAEYAEKAFGKLFKFRAISFQRKLLAKKRTMQVSIEDLEDAFGGEEAADAADFIEALQDHQSPEVVTARLQEFHRANGRLQEILTQNEYSTYVLLNVADWQIREIAVALGVSVKSINNYKNSAIEKVRKEFKK